MLHTTTITRKPVNRKGQALSAHEVQCDCNPSANTETKTLEQGIEWTMNHFGINIDEFAKGTVTRVGTNGYKYSREV